ncbi:hypothetical protein JCM8547_006497 [Rhodosporidiobolus lusitaniae]
MVLLGYASSAASAAGSYAFSAASSYVFRTDASTSSGPSLNGGTDFDTASSSSSANSRRLSIRVDSHLPRTRLPSAHHSAPPSFYSTPRPSSPCSSSSSSFDGRDDEPFRSPPRGEAEDLVDAVNIEEELYVILGVERNAKTDEIRRAFLARSRVIHPDKLPLYPPSTTAFQRLSYAYETLSKPASRRLYDLGGGRGYDPSSPAAGPSDLADETLNGVLRSVINEFLNGDFEMIRVFVTALNEGNPGLNLGDEAVDSLEGAFKRVREALLAGQRYLRLIKFELIRLYEIQHSLRSLSYFDVYGRLRLTLALTRVTLEIPMVLDRAMAEEQMSNPPPPLSSSKGKGKNGNGMGGKTKRRRKNGTRGRSPGGRGNGRKEVSEESDHEEDELEDDERGRDGQLERRGLLGTRTRGMLVITCKMLEKAERWAGLGA